MSDYGKSAWTSYRAWRKFSWIIFPALICLGVFPQVWPIFALLLIYGIYCGFRIQWFECPGCETSFFIYPKFPWFYWPFAEKCMSCGFPKWDEAPLKAAKIKIYPIPEGDISRPDPVTMKRLHRAKFLTLVLRDDPGAIHLGLDSEGWADVNNLLTRANRYGFKLTREELLEVLTVPENPSFEWDQPGDRIRWGKG